MSVTTAPAGRLRLPELVSVIALALVGAVTVAVLAVADASRTGSHPVAPAPAAQDVPTPDWLQRYLDFEAPASTDVPTPEWLQRYLDFEAPEAAGSGGSADTGVPSRPVNEGLR